MHDPGADLVTLSAIFPQPSPLDFGGRRLLARPLRLRQLAELQAWLDAAVPSPLDRDAVAIEAAEGEARRRLLVRCYVDCESWPVALGSGLADALLDLDAGRVAFLAVALAEHNPTLRPSDLAELAGAAGQAEWGRLMRICYGSDPIGALTRLIDPEAFAAGGEDRDPINWPAIVVDVADRAGWTLADVAELTPGQLALIRSKGDRAEIDCPPRPGETSDQAADRRRAYFAIDGDEPTGAESDGR